VELFAADAGVKLLAADEIVAGELGTVGVKGVGPVEIRVRGWNVARGDVEDVGVVFVLSVRRRAAAELGLRRGRQCAQRHQERGSPPSRAPVFAATPAAEEALGLPNGLERQSQ